MNGVWWRRELRSLTFYILFFGLKRAPLGADFGCIIFTMLVEDLNNAVKF